jgi:hypothetical protein
MWVLLADAELGKGLEELAEEMLLSADVLDETIKLDSGGAEEDVPELGLKTVISVVRLRLVAVLGDGVERTTSSVEVGVTVCNHAASEVLDVEAVTVVGSTTTTCDSVSVVTVPTERGPKSRSFTPEKLITLMLAVADGTETGTSDVPFNPIPASASASSG